MSSESSTAEPSSGLTSAGRDLGERDVVILGGVRTPFVKSGTKLQDTSAVTLGVRAAVEAMHRVGMPFDAVDAVIFGNVSQPASAPNIARVIALRAGFPIATPAHTVHRNCASGMEAITEAFDKIRLGQGDVYLVGGIESMSQIPIFYPPSFARKLLGVVKAKSLVQKLGAFTRFRFRDWKPIFGLEVGLRDPVCGDNMGETAENLAREFGIARDEQDEYALGSHQRTAAAQEKGFFEDEVMPLPVEPSFEIQREDVGPRKNQTLEALARLKPYFDRRFGSVTVGNSCPVTDGGVALVVASAEKARELGLAPRGRLINYCYAGCPPGRMGLGPVFATSKLLEAEELRLEDFDRIELNEAFAAQVLACERAFASEEFARRELGRQGAVGHLDRNRLNVNGGAIALGHPVGATGGRLVLTLLRELETSEMQRGLATLCIGGGQGGAVIVERLAS